MDYYLQRRPKPATHLKYLAVHYPLYLIRLLGLISEGTFRRYWAADLAWYLRGDSADQAEDLWTWMVKRFLSRHWRADTRGILDRHHAQGDLIVLVSSSPVELLKTIALEIGADHAVGTAFEKRRGHFTGRHLEPVCVDEQKDRMTRAYFAACGIEIEYQASFAYADSLADVQLLSMTGNPVATYPEPGLRKLAEERSWKIYPE